MAYKKLIPFINGENELAANVVTMAEDYCFAGADELFIYNYSKIEDEREEFLDTLKQIDRKIDIPFMVGMYAARFEDVKKAFYTGAERVVIKYDICSDDNVIKEAVGRFGSDKILIETDCPYLTPVPFRGKRNEPSYVIYTGKYISELRNVDEDVFKDQLVNNYDRLFR